MLREVSRDGLTSIQYDKVYACVVFSNDKYEVRLLHISDMSGICVTGAAYSTEEKAGRVLAECTTGGNAPGPDWVSAGRRGSV